MTEIDALFAGFCGGMMASVLSLWVYYSFITAKTKQYIQSKKIMKDRINIIAMQQDIKHLQKQISEINKEVYDNYSSQ